MPASKKLAIKNDSAATAVQQILSLFGPPPLLSTESRVGFIELTIVAEELFCNIAKCFRRGDTDHRLCGFRCRVMKEGSNVWGLNTAATLWCSAAVGACAGADLAFEAIALTGIG